ncbi:MAG TPA: D-alanine--D-alanine ligase [Verrucomicrobia bacterium]|nr:D-alanine--D-alanine ligase [Verrucomicrobiota bacterium]
MNSKKKFKKVAVLKGGPSSEREVSLRSGAAVAKGLRERGYEVAEVVVGEDCSFEVPAGTEAAFVAMHGRFGEDGTIQALLRKQGIPHTGSSPEASARAFDKHQSKPVMAGAGIPTPPFEFLRKGQQRTLPLPAVVKPVRQGSSVGVSRVFREEDWPAALEAALGYDEIALVEEYIPGRELTVGVVGDTVLPLLEIVAPDGFFDYHAKYTDGVSQHVLPRDIPEETVQACQAAALATFRALGCSGMGRVDIRLRPDGKFFVLELNNIPGMTELSLLPDAAKRMGWSFPELCERILDMV